MNDNVTFSTSNQSLWGSGSGFAFNLDVQLFEESWNSSFGPAGSIANVGYGFGSWGGQISAGTWGTIGARFYIEDVFGGHVDVDYPIQTSITYPSANTIDRGTWVTINTDYNVTPGWKLESQPPSLGNAGLEMTTNLNAYIHPQICIGGCVYPYIDVNINETFDVFTIDQYSATYPGVTGFYQPNPVLPFYCNPIGSGTCEDPAPCGAVCLPAMIETQTFPVNLPGSLYNSIGIEGFLDMPNVVTTDALNGKCLTAFGNYKYVDMSLDLMKFMGKFIPPPVGTVMSNLSNSYSFGPVGLNYTLFKSTVGLDIHNQHDLEFCPTVDGNFHFPVPLQYEEIDQFGAVIQSGQAQNVTVELGNDLRVEYPCNYEFADIDVDYDIRDDANFTSHVYDSLGFSFTLEALEFDFFMPSFQLFPGIYIPQVCVSIPYPCPTWSKPWKMCSYTVCTPGFWLIPPINISGFNMGVGPLFAANIPLANVQYDWFNSTYNLEGFSNQSGGTFTLDAMEYSASSTGLDVDCFGDATGEITATVVNGVSPFTFYWPDGATTVSATQSSTYSSLLAGNNYVTIEDANNCQVVTDYFINEPAVELKIYNAVTNDIDCFGNANGEINVSVTGGTAPYFYAWTVSPSTTNIASNLTAGTYTVTVTDSKGCTTTGTYTISEPTQLTSAVSIINHVSCFGGSDGAASVAANGGSYPYAYNWSTGGLGSTETDIANGAHSVLVTDAKGCTSTSNFNVTEPALPLSLAITSTEVSCKGGSDGTVDLTVSDGTPGYTFKWYNQVPQQLSAATEDLTNVIAQTYLVEVVDTNGCTESISVTVDEPADDLTIDLNSITHVSCFGGADGAIDVNVQGGTGPYGYAWSNAAGTEDISGLIANTYTLDVTDSKGCTAQFTIDVTEPAAALATTMISSDVLCNGDATGLADITVTGGTAPYSYLWSNGSVAEDLNGVIAGAYTVDVTDSKGCTISDNSVINEPTPLTSIPSSVTILCHGGSDGSASVVIGGGMLPYSYSWSDDQNNQMSSQADSINNLSAGDYTVIVSDSNACTISNTITVGQPTNPIGLSTVVTDVLCYTQSTGAIDLTVTGGTTGYTYLWSDASIGQDLSNSPAGIYSVVVTDNNGCIDSISAEIDEPASAIQISVSKKDVLCKGENSGWAYANVFGGTAPYLVNWNNGDIDFLTDSLISGTYTVQAIDANGCIANSGVVINEPATNIQFSATSINASCFGAGDGSITVTPYDGVQPYLVIFGDTAVNLFNNNLNSYTISDLPDGTYPVQVEDGNGCRFQDSVTVSQPDSLMVPGIVSDVLCFGNSDGEIDVTISGGTTPYTTIWSNATTNEDLTGVPAGWYSINVIDFVGCTVQGTWEITEPDAISITSQVADPSCRDNEDGSITIFTEGGTPNYSYLWSNSEITESIFNLAPGQYVLQVVDQNGCIEYDTLNINFVDLDCIFPPNAFTPDGDGYNETWILDNLYNYPEALVTIFNTWGNIVYQTDGNYIPWDGTFEGKPLPAATYYYVIDLKNGTAPYSGAVTIVKLE
jgi:gliding motility-associated-like protein